MQALQVLQKWWGYSEFRPGQQDIINASLAGRDVLALLPTGGGKSLCYQIPALMLSGITVVISPLISLMQDQVQQLVKRGIPATFLASSLSKPELLTRMSQVQTGAYKLLYISPERLAQPAIQSVLKTCSIGLIVIDEAHCVSEWGHSFRPSYRAIAQQVKQIRPETPVQALTASATPMTAQDIVHTLKLQTPFVFQSSVVRHMGIHVFASSSTVQKDLQLLMLLHQLPERRPILIYASTRQSVERVSAFLRQLSPLLHLGSVGTYHAGMSSDDRETVQEHFLSNTVTTMVATNAFGMGIDKPDIDTVIHYQIPGSIEQYYQEIGRAGRGGQFSKVFTLFHDYDIHIQASMAQKSVASETKRSLDKISALVQLMKSTTCRMQGIGTYFGERQLGPCGFCDRCQPLDIKLESVFEQAEYLFSLRDRLAKQHALHPLLLLSDAQVQLLSILRPSSVEALSAIPTFGNQWIDRWGKYFIDQP